MIVYPSSENRTVLKFQPWATWVLLLLSLAAFLVFFLPAKWDYDRRAKQHQEQIRTELTKQHEAGNLSQVFLIRAQEDLAIIGDPAHRDIFPSSVHQLFEASDEIPQPLETWIGQGSPHHFIYASLPHHWLVLILACICLPPLGFIFEHLYDRLILAGLVILIAPLWIVLAPHMGSAFWPHLTMSWSMTIATLIAAFYVNAPRSVVTMTFRTWLLGNLEARIKIPTLMFAALYFLGLTLVNMRFEGFQAYSSGEQLATAALLGGLLGLGVQLLPNRDQQLDANPEAQINQQLARAEVYFDEQQKEKAVLTLKELLDLNPNLAQARRIADLAWEHHQTELAERAYKNVLRQTLRKNDLSLTFSIVETMVFHNLTIPDSVFLKTAELGAKDGRIDQVRKLIPYMDDRIGIQPSDILSIQERLVTTVFDQVTPDRETLYELKLWFESHAPQSGALAKIDHFLNQFSREAGLSGNYGQAPTIHKHLKISLLGINSNQLKIQTGDRTEKTVPWTAVTGCFGCQLNQGPDSIGTIFIKFKRKIFSCFFSNRDVLVKDQQGMLLSFPQAWRLLEEHCAQSLPFVAYDQFESTPNSRSFEQDAEAYIKNKLG